MEPHRVLLITRSTYTNRSEKRPTVCCRATSTGPAGAFLVGKGKRLQRDGEISEPPKRENAHMWVGCRGIHTLSMVARAVDVERGSAQAFHALCSAARVFGTPPCGEQCADLVVSFCNSCLTQGPTQRRVAGLEVRTALSSSPLVILCTHRYQHC